MKPSFKGIIASTGLAFGRAFILNEPSYTVTHEPIEDVEYELKKFNKALEQSIADIVHLRKKISEEQGEENAAIFDAHQLLLKDPDMIRAVEQLIIHEKQNAAWALEVTIEQYIALFEQINDEYMKERITDIRDVSNRLLSYLLNEKTVTVNEINEDVILIAREITPSHIALADRKFVQGFITVEGGRHSHAAIIAHTQGIPAIGGAQDALENVNQDDFLIVDGINGIVHVNPTSETIQKYERVFQQLESEKRALLALRDEPTTTADGKNISLLANIASSADVEHVIENGAEGIGLFRTEFAYMNSNHFPSEDKSFHSYKTVLENMGNVPVTIRTLDIGGDKQLDYWDLPQEANPFLGLRAIRLSLSEQQIFKTQLRALLRASVYGNLHIMFPMISTLEELQEVKELLEEQKILLKQNGHAVSDHIKIGMMVETPAAAIMAEHFAKEVDFFSIGTNDLIQYTFAADRMNETVAHLYQPYHPAILRFIKMIVEAGKKEQIKVSVCGDLASNKEVASLLLGLGVDELSMPPSKILDMRQFFQEMNVDTMKDVVHQALAMQNADEVKRLISAKVTV